jgi:hypothetical protein
VRLAGQNRPTSAPEIEEAMGTFLSDLARNSSIGPCLEADPIAGPYATIWCDSFEKAPSPLRFQIFVWS